MLIPITAGSGVDCCQAGFAGAGKVENELVFALCAITAGFVQSGQKRAHIGRGAHHLVGGGQVCPASEPQHRGNFLPGGQQVEQNLLVGGVGAGVVGQEHALPKCGIVRKGHNRLHVGLVGREGYPALTIRRMALKIVGGQTVQLGKCGLDGLSPLLNVAPKLEREPRSFLMQSLEVVAGGLVLIDAR